MMDYVEQALSKGEKPTYVKNIVNAVKSGLRYYGLKIERKIKLPTQDYVDEMVPTRERATCINTKIVRAACTYG